MTAVPDRVLQWLHSNLRAQYHFVDRTYSDVAQTLTRYPSLSPKTDVHTFDNGTSALLLQLQGNLPVRYHTSEYRYPITLWISHAYPREPPYIYVKPTPEMAVRAGQYVSTEGRIYHPYLAQWQHHWDRSNLLEILHILTDIFAKEPPLVARQERQSQQWENPPMRQDGQLGSPSTSRGRLPSQSVAPPKPPKPSERQQQHGPPALPPKPQPQQRISSSSYGALQGEAPGIAGYRSPPPLPGQQGPPLPPLPPNASNQTQRPHPPSSGHPGHRLGQHFPQQQVRARVGSASNFSQSPQAQYFASPLAHQQLPYSIAPGQGSQSQTQFVSAQPQQQRTKQPAPDLLSSALEVTLPSQADHSLPAPPIPPNPEKDALLHTVSQTLTARLSQITSQNFAAIPALEAQNAAMQQAYRNMSRELSQLQELDKSLASNENILHNTMREADKQLDSVRRKEKPNVDEVLVAPTVVGEQLYGLVADEKAIGDAMFALTRALDRGRIGADVYLKQTRSLAREQFLKKALIKKIARGMVLDGA